MQTVEIFFTETEAQFAKQYLANHGIEAHIIGAKNYQAHVIGGTSGRYELKVLPDDVAETKRLLAKVEARAEGKKPNLEIVHHKKPASTSEDAPLTVNYYRKSMVFALLALCLCPVGFNVVSLINAKLFWSHAKHDPKRGIKLFLIFLVQLPGLSLAYFLLDYLFKSWI